MAKYTGSVCRLCRREGLKLFLKGQRCYTDKCAIERREYAPGQHGQAKTKPTEYGIQLREKQKVKRVYNLLERQFRNFFRKSEQMKGVTGDNLLRMLEARLDNMVYRLGFADSRAQARQMVVHGHFLVNGRRVNRPSYLTREGDEVTVKEGSRKLERINQALEAVDRRGIPAWLELDKEAFLGRIKTLPSREELTLPIQEQLIVELYSK